MLFASKRKSNMKMSSHHSSNYFCHVFRLMLFISQRKLKRKMDSHYSSTCVVTHTRQDILSSSSFAFSFCARDMFSIKVNPRAAIFLSFAQKIL